MSTTLINVEVDADSAEIFRDVSVEDRSKLSALWTLLLRDYQHCPTSLRQLMDEIGAKAKARGLTPEILESILHAD